VLIAPYSQPELTPLKGRKAVNYAESDDEDDEILAPITNSARGRATKRRRVSIDDDSDDEFGLDAATQNAMLEDGMSRLYKWS
jgi:DNA mismatch repair protein MSH6